MLATLVRHFARARIFSALMECLFIVSHILAMSEKSFLKFPASFLTFSLLEEISNLMYSKMLFLPRNISSFSYSASDNLSDIFLIYTSFTPSDVSDAVNIYCPIRSYCLWPCFYGLIHSYAVGLTADSYNGFYHSSG